jgi:hypothetical protein
LKKTVIAKNAGHEVMRGRTFFWRQNVVFPGKMAIFSLLSNKNSDFDFSHASWMNEEKKTFTTTTMARKRAKKPKVSTNASAKDFRELGAEIMNRSMGGSEGIFDTRWIAHFGAEPEVCVDVWSRLDEDDTLSGPDDEAVFPCHLLWALLFLKTYDTEPVLAGMCGADEDTLRKWAWDFVEKVSDLEDQVVSLFTATPCLLCLSLVLLLTAMCFESGQNRSFSRTEKSMTSATTASFRSMRLIAKLKTRENVWLLFSHTNLSLQGCGMSLAVTFGLEILIG